MALLSPRSTIKLERWIRYNTLDDIFFAPAYQLVKLHFKSGETLYLNTARDQLPEVMVEEISNNLKLYWQNVEASIFQHSIAQTDAVETAKKYLDQKIESIATATFVREQVEVSNFSVYLVVKRGFNKFDIFNMQLETHSRLG